MLRQQHHSELAQAERHISEAKAHIARQREIIEYLKSNGHDYDVAVSMLHALEASLHVFERHRQQILRIEDAVSHHDFAQDGPMLWRGRGFKDPA
jgi:hypothetical protein